MRRLTGLLGPAVLPFAVGLGLATGQAPLGWAPVAFAALAVLIGLGARAATARAAALVGWSGGAGYFAGGLFWIVEPFFVDPVRHGWMAPFALVLLPGGLALFWAAAFAAGHRGAVGLGRTLPIAVALAAVEMSRAWVLTGFPWALVGYMWIGWPPAQAAALIGPHGLTLATTIAAALAALAVGSGRARLAGPVAAAVLFGGGWTWGAAMLARPGPPDTTVTLRLVQPNAEQSLKWDPERAQEFLMRLMTATASASDGPLPDVTIWPETAVPYLLNDSDTILGQIDAITGGRTVVFGVPRREDGRYYNSLAVTAPGGTLAQVYDKHHLVPFGEYVPFGEVLGRLGIEGMAASHGGGFSAGPGPVALDLGAAGRALPLICYEMIFPQHLRLAERPDWVVQITNDAWFGEVSGPYQHLAQARLRAIEQGLPVVRVANTGVSAVIDARGRVRAELPLGTQGFLDAALPAAVSATPYARTGDWPVLAALVLLALLFAGPWRAKRIDPARRGA
ncbi:MAG: apolipoprotein N-acyltransferase [Rhodobacteraceae bacterium]|nr:apolipoprotein N-acyltransferase [Paracoccaceae bacterium]